MEKFLEETVADPRNGIEYRVGWEDCAVTSLNELRRCTVAVGKIIQHPHMIHLDTGDVELNEGEHIRIVYEGDEEA